VAEGSALEGRISVGAFVSINIGGNGAFQVAMRGVEAPGNLSERERPYLVVSSEPYLLVSEGVLGLGGLEAVGSYAGAEKVEIPLMAPFMQPARIFCRVARSAAAGGAALSLPHT
jgi:hypothetical protein